MGQGTRIEWTNATWNPVTGCTKTSVGCKNCYAERIAERLRAMGMPQYRNGFGVTLQPRSLPLPLTWKHPRLIFVNSMSDLFHPSIPESYIRKVFEVMEKAHWHTFQILTKRPEIAKQYSAVLRWPANVWMGTTIETAEYLGRLVALRAIPARVRFLSLEPLLSPMGSLPLDGIDWVIVGGESGPRCRPLDRHWVTEIRDQCLSQGVAFFFKQWGGVSKKAAGRLLDGRTWDAMPSPRGAASAQVAFA